MRPVAEGEVRVGLAGHVQLVRAAEDARVPVGRDIGGQHRVARRDHHVPEPDVDRRDPGVDGVAEHHEPQHLLDGGGDQLRAALQQVKLLRVGEQRVHEVGELMRGGLTAAGQ